MKAKLKKIIYLLTPSLLMFLVFMSVQLNFNQKNDSNLPDIKISTSIQPASALPIEIYGWGCEGTDICGHVSGFMCYVDNIGGDWRYRPC